LYVGVTRARNDLVIYDGSDSSILWNSPELGDLVFRTDDADFLNQLWNVISSPEEWRRQGEYFFDREFFRAAMECFKNGGDDARHALAAARYAEQQDRPAEAAAHFERAGRWADAGRNYERAGDARRALATWERAGDRERIRACRAAVLEADGDWSGAADLFLEQGESERAVHCLVQAQRFEEAAALCEKPLKQPAKAAMYYEKAGRLEPAVRLLLRLKQYARAAEFEERLGRLAEAERDWRRGGDPEQLIRFYERTDQSRKLLAIYERARDLDKAVRCLRGVKDRPALLREAGALFEAKKYFPALVRFTVLDQRAEIGRCLLALKRYDEAAVVLRETGQFEQAGVAYRRLGQFRESVECFLQSDEDRRAGFTAARQALRRVWDNEWFSGQIGHHLRGRQFEQAAVFFDVGGDPASAGVCLARAGRIEEAHALWGKCRSLAEFNTSAGLAAGMETSGPLAEYLLSLPLDGLQDAWERFVQSDSVIEMMERYLTHPVREAPIRNWLERLDAWVGYGTHWEHRLVMWESIGDYDALVLLAEIQLRYLLFTERDLRFRFQEDLRKMGLGGSPEARAIRHWFLGETAAFEELCGRIEPRPGLLLLLGKSARYPEAVARLEADGEWIQAAGILSEHRRFEEAGRLYEAAGDLFAAAQAYAAAGQPGRSGPLLEKAGLWLQAAEHYFTAGEYARAIEMFNREKKPKLRRIAAAYERMKDFPNALRIWEQLGDRKNYQRCLRKSGRDTLF
jgi:tetratricopeptide (TPR) repeat protein